MSGRERIAVIGIGNPLKRDEGVGVRVVEELMTLWDFPGSISVIDAGTMGLGMIPIFQEHDAAIVVDAVDGTGTPPGTVLIMTPDELAPSQVMHSLHDMRFPDVLQAASLIGCECAVSVVGIQTASISTDADIGLTREVEKALAVAVATVLGLLAERGIVPAERDAPSKDAELLRAIRLGTEIHGLDPIRPVDDDPDPGEAARTTAQGTAPSEDPS